MLLLRQSNKSGFDCRAPCALNGIVLPWGDDMTDPLDRLNTALTDRYRIVRELGAGGMATVYLAEDLRHHRQVAVKVLRQDLAASLGAERFLREIEIAARLHHPHILALYDSGGSGDVLF